MSVAVRRSSAIGHKSLGNMTEQTFAQSSGSFSRTHRHLVNVNMVRAGLEVSSINARHQFQTSNHEPVFQS